MKKSLFFIVLVFLTGETLSPQSNSIGKNNESKTRLHSLGLGFGVFGINPKSNSSTGGLSLYGDVVVGYKNHLFSVYGEGGTETVFSSTDYSSINLMYGRVLFDAKSLHIEGYSGIGYFYLHNEGKKIATYGLPIRLKLEFGLGKRVGIGLNPNVVVNGGSVVYSGMLSLVFKIPRKSNIHRN